MEEPIHVRITDYDQNTYIKLLKYVEFIQDEVPMGSLGLPYRALSMNHSIRDFNNELDKGEHDNDLYPINLNKVDIMHYLVASRYININRGLFITAPELGIRRGSFKSFGQKDKRPLYKHPLVRTIVKNPNSNKRQITYIKPDNSGGTRRRCRRRRRLSRVRA